MSAGLTKERKKVKHRPHQSNQNRIVLASREGSTLRIALKCYPHNLRNGSPIGTRLQRRLLADMHEVKGPAFLMPIADARWRQTLTGRPVMAPEAGKKMPT